METLANVPTILRKGPEWFRCIGTTHSKGTKVFALAGRVLNIGLIEVPMGISLREIIYSIGGGILDGGKFKAVQTGGPCPVSHLVASAKACDRLLAVQIPPDARDSVSFSHGLDPHALLAGARELYASHPEAILVTMGGECFDLTDHLSPAVAENLPALVECVRQRIAHDGDECHEKYQHQG